MSNNTIKIGELIDGRYRVLSIIGSGGMGTLYRVMDEIENNRVVALKTIQLKHSKKRVSKSNDMFQNEFKILTQLKHPNLVSVYNFGVISEIEMYFTMELIQGNHLNSSEIKDSKTIISYIIQICRALNYLHSRGVVHGDLKPENIIIKGNEIQIVDFGVAVSARSNVRRIEYYSPGYSAPEIKNRAYVDHKADLYSIGAVWYTLIVGEPPLFMFGAEQLIKATLDDTLKNQNDNYFRISNIVSRLLSDSPSDRYVNSIEIITAINTITGNNYTLETKETAGSYALRGRFTGREKEINELNVLWEDAQSNNAKVVTIGGESGVGKTRLVEEFIVNAELIGVRVLRGQCVESGGGAYKPWREILHNIIRHLESNKKSLMRNYGPVLATLFPGLWTRDYMNDLEKAEVIEPKAAHHRLNMAIIEVIKCAADIRPTVIVIEDAHWADEVTLSFTELLSQNITQKGLMVCLTYRDDEIEYENASKISAMEHADNIIIKSLPPKSVITLACSMLGLSTLPVLLSERIQNTTGGNPFFIQELIRSMAEDGDVLKRSTEGWSVDHKATERHQLPVTIHKVIHKRLKYLSAEAQELLEYAAISGMIFWDDLLIKLTNTAKIKIQNLLGEVLEKELILERESLDFKGQREFVFAKSIVQEVCYNNLSKKKRKNLHSITGNWLITHIDKTGIHFGLVAEHFLQAEEYDKANKYLLSAGDQFRLVYAHKEAIKYYEIALAFLEDQKEYGKAARLLMKLGLTYYTAFDFQKSQDAYSKAFEYRQLENKIPKGTLLPAPHALRELIFSPVTFDSNIANTVFSTRIIRQLFSGLLLLDGEKNVVPDIAEHWEVLDGGRIFIFHLKNNIKWSDGVPLTAKDFEYAWKRALAPDIDSPNALMLYDIKGAKSFHQRQSTINDVGIHAVDDLTLNIELKEPAGHFLFLLTHTIWFAIPKHIVEIHGDDWTNTEHIVTNGPFKIDTYKKDHSMTLSRNPKYHGKFGGNIENVELMFRGTDTQPILEVYKRDDIDTLEISSSEISEVRQNYVEEYTRIPTFLSIYVGFNINLPPFDNVLLRRAFVLSINKSVLANEIMHGTHSPAHGGFIPPGISGHSSDIGLPYDPVLARQLLNEAGFPDGHDLPSISVMITSSREKEFEYFKTEWEKNLNAKIEPIKLDWSSFIVKLVTKPPHIFFLAWTAPYPDPDSYLRVCINSHKKVWQNETYNKLVRKIRLIMDQDQRVDLYKQADKMLVQDAMLMPLYYGRYNGLIKPWVSNFSLTPSSGVDWKDTILTPH